MSRKCLEEVGEVRQEGQVDERLHATHVRRHPHRRPLEPRPPTRHGGAPRLGVRHTPSRRTYRSCFFFFSRAPSLAPLDTGGANLGVGETGGAEYLAAPRVKARAASPCECG